MAYSRSLGFRMSSNLLRVYDSDNNSYHPNRKLRIERVNRTMAELMAMAVKECPDDWNV